jgi:hypothetical protein
MKVPMGRYQLDVELRSGESLVVRPPRRTIGRSDVDAQQDFVIGILLPRR